MDSFGVKARSKDKRTFGQKIRQERNKLRRLAERTNHAQAEYVGRNAVGKATR